jgi:ESS family glutamate:Na+ symporter
VTEIAMTLHLDMVQTLALAAVVLFAGYGIRRRIGVLDRYNIPAPVVGGFLFAILALALRVGGILAFEFTATLQTPLMIAFFTSIGLGASLGLLRVGGPQVLLFWGLATVLVVFQDALGVLVAKGLGVNPFLGLVAGSITMTGGHGTGAAFGKLLDQDYGLAGGVTLAMAAATFGLVSGGLIGGPIATYIVKRFNPRHATRATGHDAAASISRHESLDEEIDTEPPGEGATAYNLLKIITVVLVAMWAGSILSEWLRQFMTLPAYIGAMIVAAVLRNAADLLGLVRIEQRVVDDIGTIALNLFLAMALMTLNLVELKDLALPMLAILAAQVVLMAGFAYFLTYPLMGRDYDAAVMAAGHCGFGMGATPNAVANMEAITEKFGPAPRAFLVLPMVGAFFIDFTNAIIITAFINVLA